MFVDYSWSQIRIEEVNLEFFKRRVLMQEICNQLCAAILNLFSNKNKTTTTTTAKTYKHIGKKKKKQYIKSLVKTE